MGSGISLSSPSDLQEFNSIDGVAGNVDDHDNDDNNDRYSEATGTSDSSEMFVAALATMRAEAGSHPDDKNISDGAETMTHLSVHAALGQVTLLRQLLTRESSNPNEVDRDRDRCPLHWAAARGQTRCVALLLDFNADPSQPDASGATPMQLAERYGHETTAFFLRHGHPVEDTKRVGEGVLTPPSLHAALDQPDRLKHILTRVSADPNERDSDSDRTPLHWASARGHTRCAQLLLEANADLHARDAAGRTPIELALSLRHPETYHLLTAVEEEYRLRLSTDPRLVTALRIPSQNRFPNIYSARRPKSVR